MSEPQLFIGACGWQHPAWQNVFYPDDLPEDWQLGYYSNEFRVVLVPADYWHRFQLDVAELLEDSESSLRFILECPILDSDRQPLEISVCTESIELFGSRCAGVLFRVGSSTVAEESTLRKKILTCNDYVPTCVEFSAAPDPSWIEWCQQRNIGICWHGDNEPLAAGRLKIARIRDPSLSARDLRRIIELCLAWNGNNGLTVLLFDSEPPPLELMKNADVILDLL